MFQRVLTSVFGSRNERILRTLNKTVIKINALEPRFEALDDAALRAMTDEFRKRVSDGESLDSLLPEAFAVVREAARRVIGLPAAWSCIWVALPKCVRARARPWLAPCRSI